MKKATQREVRKRKTYQELCESNAATRARIADRRKAASAKKGLQGQSSENLKRNRLNEIRDGKKRIAENRRNQ